MNAIKILQRGKKTQQIRCKYLSNPHKDRKLSSRYVTQCPYMIIIDAFRLMNPGADGYLTRQQYVDFICAIERYD